MENTAQFILERVAPIFNRQGYIGTSLSDLTAATNLTKGAIYCNFENKEDLALKAFHLNFRIALAPLQSKLLEAENGLAKIRALTVYYRSYYDIAQLRGGCPILNVGIDAQHNNPKLFESAKRKSQRLIDGLFQIIVEGQRDKSIKNSVNAEAYAKNIYSMIEGSLFLAFTFEKRDYVDSILDHIDFLIQQELST